MKSETEQWIQDAAPAGCGDDPNRLDRSILVLFAVPAAAALLSFSVMFTVNEIRGAGASVGVVKVVFVLNGILASAGGIFAGLLIRGGGLLRSLVAFLLAPLGFAFYLGALAMLMGVVEFFS